MESFIKVERRYPCAEFRYVKGNTDIFSVKQFHDFYELYLLLNGTVEFNNDRYRRPLKPFDLVIVPAGDYHRFRVAPTTEAHYERFALFVHPTMFGKGELEAMLRGKEIVSLPSDHRIVEHLWYLKQAAATYDDRDFERVLSSVATDIVFILKQLDSVDDRSPSLLHPLSSKIIRYIHEHYRESITIGEIAEHFFLSPSSISHIFKNDFGVGIKQYITQKRLHEMRRRLQEGRKPQEVAADFGFTNYSTFYRCYRQYFGVSPSKDR